MVMSGADVEVVDTGTAFENYAFIDQQVCGNDVTHHAGIFHQVNEIQRVDVSVNTARDDDAVRLDVGLHVARRPDNYLAGSTHRAADSTVNPQRSCQLKITMKAVALPYIAGYYRDRVWRFFHDCSSGSCERQVGHGINRFNADMHLVVQNAFKVVIGMPDMAYLFTLIDFFFLRDGDHL